MTTFLKISFGESCTKLMSVSQLEDAKLVLLFADNFGLLVLSESGL